MEIRAERQHIYLASHLLNVATSVGSSSWWFRQRGWGGAAKEGVSKRENVWVLGLTKEVSSSAPSLLLSAPPLYSLPIVLSIKIPSAGAGEMAQQVRALTALP